MEINKIHVYPSFQKSISVRTVIHPGERPLNETFKVSTKKVREITRKAREIRKVKPEQSRELIKSIFAIINRCTGYNFNPIEQTSIRLDSHQLRIATENRLKEDIYITLKYNHKRKT